MIGPDQASLASVFVALASGLAGDGNGGEQPGPSDRASGMIPVIDYYDCNA